MANQLKTKLATINSELDALKAQVLAGKKLIAEAIQYCGNANVHPYDKGDGSVDPQYMTFAQYATLIKKLKSSNSMILEFRLKGGSNYQRTLILPMNFAVTGLQLSQILNKMATNTLGSNNHDTAINWIAKSLIAAPQTLEMNMPMMDTGFGIGGFDMIADQGGGMPVGEATEEDMELPQTEVVVGPNVPVDGEDEIDESFGGYAPTPGFGIGEPTVSPAVDEEEAPEVVIPTILDNYGNECIPADWEGYGDVEIPSMQDIHDYLTEDEQAQMLSAMNGLGIEPVNAPMMQSMGEPMMLADNQTSDAVYDFVVNWGDDSDPCEFHMPKKAVNQMSQEECQEWWDENKDAIFHTYSIGANSAADWNNETNVPEADRGQIFDVTITGSFRRLYSNTSSTSMSFLVENGNYFLTPDHQPSLYGNDGMTSGSEYRLLSGCNYLMRHGLEQVLSWGNTLLQNCANAFAWCEKLKKVPILDMTNSFDDVTDCSYFFFKCAALMDIPFNANTNKGLFTNCKKVTTFKSAFSYCTGMTGAIPTKLFNGCDKVSDVSGAFAYSKFTGRIPDGMFAGMTSITAASELFASCNLSGSIDDCNLFSDQRNITTIYRLFYNCEHVTGVIKNDFIGNLSSLNDMRQAFYNCKGITGIEQGAFHGITANNINCRQTFYNVGITEIPQGLLSSMTGSGLLLEKMFDCCTSLATIWPNEIKNLRVANARGMFGGCTNLKCVGELQENDDWHRYETINKWYGAFAGTSITQSVDPEDDSIRYNQDMPLEITGVGGHEKRRYKQGNVGKIIIQITDKAEGDARTEQSRVMVEAADYDSFMSGNTLSYENAEGSFESIGFDPANEYAYPIGWVYADVWLKKADFRATLANGAGNVISDKGALASTANDAKIHKIYAAVWSDTTKKWVDAQNHAVDVTTITNTSDVNVCYSTFNWYGSATEPGTYEWKADSGNGASYWQKLRPTRYNGEVYTDALNKFIFERGSWVSLGDARCTAADQGRPLYVNNVVRTDLTATEYPADGPNVCDGYTEYEIVSALPAYNISYVGKRKFFMPPVENAVGNERYHYTAYIADAGASAIVPAPQYDVYINQLNSNRYPAVSYCNNYVVWAHNNNTNNASNPRSKPGKCFFADATDGWDLWVMREWHNMACQALITRSTRVASLSGEANLNGKGFTSSNCLPFRTGTRYYSTVKRDFNVVVYPLLIGCILWSINTWDSNYVRPSVAFDV